MTFTSVNPPANVQWRELKSQPFKTSTRPGRAAGRTGKRQPGKRGSQETVHRTSSVMADGLETNAQFNGIVLWYRPSAVSNQTMAIPFGSLQRTRVNPSDPAERRAALNPGGAG